MLIHSTPFRASAYVPDLTVQKYDEVVRSLSPVYSLQADPTRNFIDTVSQKVAEAVGTSLSVEDSSMCGLRIIQPTPITPTTYWKLSKTNFPSFWKTGDFTIAVCVNIADDQQNGTYFTNLFNCNYGNGFAVHVRGTTKKVGVAHAKNTGVYDYIESQSTVTKGFHIIIVTRKSNIVTLWVNGVKEASMAVSGYIPPSPTHALIGGSPNNQGDAEGISVNGGVTYRHVAWFARAVTDEEIGSLWKSAILNYANRTSLPDVVTFDLTKPIAGLEVVGQTSGAAMKLIADKTPIYRKGLGGDMGHVLRYGQSIFNAADYRCFYTDDTFASRFNMYQSDVCFTADVSAEKLYSLVGVVLGKWKQIAGQGDINLNFQSGAPASLSGTVAVYSEQTVAFSSPLTAVAGQRMRVDFVKVSHYYMVARDGVPIAVFAAKNARAAYTSGNDLVLGTYRGAVGQLYPDISASGQGHDLNCYGLTLKRLS